MAAPKTIGLVGGVASGKSTVARIFAELGAGLLDADRTGHALLDDDEVLADLRRRWGESVLTDDGHVDRRALAGRVFGTSDQATADRQFLEDLLHPRIGRQLEQQRNELIAAGYAAIVLDAPLLLEAGWRPLCNLVVMIDTPREERFRRAAERGWTETEFNRREAAQWSVEEKRRSADVVLLNSGDEETLRRVVTDFWHREIAPAS